MKDGRDKPNEKIKDMTRSVLPSKARKGARDDKRNMHRKYRHDFKQNLNSISGVSVDDLHEIYANSEDDFADKANELKHYLPYIIGDRRNADKIEPFIRWAQANTKHLSNDVEKYYMIKSLIGSSVIKDHALGHFVNIRRASDPFYAFWLWKYDYPNPCPWLTRVQLHGWIREAWELDHPRFNRFLQEVGYLTRECRDKQDPDYYQPCWTDHPTQQKYHLEDLCEHNTLVNCIEANVKKQEAKTLDVKNGVETAEQYWNKVNGWSAKTSAACWLPITMRSHDSTKCHIEKRIVTHPDELEGVTDFFWRMNETPPRRYQNMTDEETQLYKFLKEKNIVY